MDYILANIAAYPALSECVQVNFDAINTHIEETGEVPA
jgi:hypothetical protein